MGFPQSQTLNLSWMDTLYKNFHSKSILQFKTCLNFPQEFKCDIEKENCSRVSQKQDLNNFLNWKKSSSML